MWILFCLLIHLVEFLILNLFKQNQPMKKLFISFFAAFLCLLTMAQQANLFTIPNQSAHFVRMPSRHASQEVDAVFFNPAGTTKMKEGFHFSINNQVLNQITDLESSYVFYNENPKNYPGRVTGFFFPSVMMAYNIKKVSFHGAVLMVGGTGGIQYDNLPISDRGIADIPIVLKESFLNGLDRDLFNETGINPMYSDISNYRFDFRNNGLGYSPGIQAGMAYEINEYISVSADFRFTRQVVSANGYVENIQIYNENHGGWQSPGNLLRYIAEEENLPVYNGIANIYEDLSGDRLIDVKQRGSGITPIFSVNITPTPKLNIGLKYEHRTRTSLTTTVFGGKDGGVFTQDERIRSDLPGFFSAGLGYDITDRLRVHLGSRVFIMNNIDFNGREAYFDGNYFEVESALQYQLFDNFFISGGYTFMRPKVKNEFQNDVDFWIPGHTGALGFRWDALKEVSFNVGGLFTLFNTQSITQNHLYADGNALAAIPENYESVYDITYRKKAFIIALGVDFRFLKKNKKTLTESSMNQEDIPYYFRTQ